MEELVRNWPGADGSEGISKLFQFSVRGPLTVSLRLRFVHEGESKRLRCLAVCVGDEVDATGRLEEGNLQEEKLVE